MAFRADTDAMPRYVVNADFARTLEIELAAANARESRLREAATRVSKEWHRLLYSRDGECESIYNTTPELRDALSAQGAALDAAPSGPAPTSIS